MMTQQKPDNKYIVENNAFMRVPKYTWQWCFNDRWDGIIVNVEKPVCWFHRVMQRLILGIHWRKIEEKK